MAHEPDEELAHRAEAIGAAQERLALAPLVGEHARARQIVGVDELEAVLAKIDEYLGEDIQGCIRFDGFDELEGRIEYTDLAKNRVQSIATESLKRRLRALPDV